MARSRKLSKRASRKRVSPKRVSRKRSILKRISKSLKKMLNKIKRTFSRKSKRVTRKRASPKRSSPKPKKLTRTQIYDYLISDDFPKMKMSHRMI